MNRWEQRNFNSINRALKQQRLLEYIEPLSAIVPDLSYQETSSVGNEYYNFKRRGMHCFQISLLLRAIDSIQCTKKISVMDIGDSAGTHMLYLRELLKQQSSDVTTISVNLDPHAIGRISAKGLTAICARAEDVDLQYSIDLYTTFEMVEHLHDPSYFFYRLAKKGSGRYLLMTVPYLKQSRVGLWNIRQNIHKDIIAEEEHIFELSPEDWMLLALHSGWKTVWHQRYLQYPTGIPFYSWQMKRHWRHHDFEGFWGVLFEKDLTFAEHYLDWQEL